MPKMNELVNITGNLSTSEVWYLDQDWVNAGIGRMKANGYQPKIENGVAIIPVYGVLSRKGSAGGWFEDQEASMENIESDFLKAMNNKDVSGIVLDISSPGGTVSGTTRLAQVIRENKSKPVIAYTAGMMASAAYYIGSAADKVISDKSAMVGSIGTILTHMDYSARAAQMGVKVTHITGGKDKALANSYEPLTESGKEYLQGIVNEAYTQFKADVVLHRGEKIDIEKVSTGRVFTASNALELGLIDQIGNIEDAIEMAKTKGENEMFKTLAELKEKCVDLCKEFRAEIEAELGVSHKAEIETAKAQAVTDAMAAEKTRVAEIEALSGQGQEKVVKTLIAEGKTVIEATKALFEDLKARPPKTEPKNEAEKALDLLNAGAPASAGQPKDTVNESTIQAWQKITDPMEKAKFFQTNKEKISAEQKIK
jgi:signal peptide peptidase SppA